MDFGVIDTTGRLPRASGHIDLTRERGMPPEYIDETIRSRVEMAGASEGKRISFHLSVRGQTKVACPLGGTLYDEFVGARRIGPWRRIHRVNLSGVDLGEVLYFDVHTTNPDNTLSIALKTNSGVWIEPWVGFPPDLAAEANQRNRARLTSTLLAMRKALRDARVEHLHEYGDVPTTEDGFAWRE
jgi:hypothetical protein